MLNIKHFLSDNLLYTMATLSSNNKYWSVLYPVEFWINLFSKVKNIMFQIQRAP